MPRNWHYRKGLVERARELRKDMTPAEKKLWFECLRDHQPRFYRQRAIAGFIVDFYCSSLRLVVEVDGESHFTEQGMAYDAERTAVLEGLGLQVLRFTNAEVMGNLEAVFERISSLPSTPPQTPS